MECSCKGIKRIKADGGVRRRVQDGTIFEAAARASGQVLDVATFLMFAISIGALEFVPRNLHSRTARGRIRFAPRGIIAQLARAPR